MDGLSLEMTGTEVARLQSQNESFNLALTNSRVAKTELGKDEFLKILITQLQNQDPTEPMQDREFIAQMAQFSTLEQMTNMSSEFERLGSLLQSGQAVNVLGKTVDIVLGDAVVTGRVQEVTGGDYPQVLVNGSYYDYSNVQRVRAGEGDAE
ncbi:MAG: flagellar hook assembly protein FlgD [Spirochaetota bacterium]